ncbi:Asp23/Gls24 family envelope stress response protein [Micromonospora echinofusca]|uniref:Asp23/Gls24 family envelope stress response protein n=1 Tax=Micromonospora echinofusca TaxID=47858 RepID=UPI0034162097
MTNNNDKATPTMPARSTAEMPSLPRQSRLNTAEGRITVAENVVQKIAGIACREVSGVQAMGNGNTRAFGALRERIPGSNGPNIAQGVGVEVGETEAAIDLDVVVEYGISIADLGRSVQRNVKTAIERMTGLNVVEVNVSVDDVHMPEAPEDRTESRVS